jgi:hypothetical protein
LWGIGDATIVDAIAALHDINGVAAGIVELLVNLSMPGDCEEMPLLLLPQLQLLNQIHPFRR